MGLRIWLPLNGDYWNRGLSNVEINGNPSATYMDGKIGKCLNTSSIVEMSVPEGILSTNYSLGMWVKSKPTNTTNSVWWRITRVTFTDGTINTLYLASEGRYKVEYTPEYNTYCDTQQWHYLIYVFEGTKLYSYVDGKLIGSANVTNTERTISSFSVGGNNNVYLSDVRLYDHCLSNKEVEELSKGLIAHYPLRDRINNNLITVMSAGARTTQNGKYGLKADFSQNLDTYGYFNVSPSLELNKTYTLSFDVSNFPSGGIWGWRLWNNANYEFTVTGNGHYSFTFIPDAAKLPSGYELNKFLFDDGGRTNPANIVTFSNFKIEEGPIDSFWTPHSADDNYNAYSQLVNRICDCSGNNYDLTIVGANIYNTKDSARNDNCISIPNGQSSYLKCDSAFFPYDEVTMNCWFKNDNGITGVGGYHIPFASQSGHFEISIQTGGQLRTGVFVNGSRSVLTTASKNVSDGNWHMLTMTYDGATIKRYVDGEMVANSSTTIQGSLSGGNKLLTIGHYGTDGNYGNKNSCMSDVRLYATALSDEDILKLYQVGVAIDDSQNIYAYEFIEDNAIDFKKNGTVNFESFTNENKCAVYKDLLTSAYFIEK